MFHVDLHSVSVSAPRSSEGNGTSDSKQRLGFGESRNGRTVCSSISGLGLVYRCCTSFRNDNSIAHRHYYVKSGLVWGCLRPGASSSGDNQGQVVEISDQVRDPPAALHG